jgi:lysyl-tRNA synthetase class 2
MADWYPSASRDTLLRRAELRDAVRAYFRSQSVVEVDTPLVGRYPATDPALTSFSVCEHRADGFQPVGYLQTSPEFHMKRLLAAGHGDIYQVCPAFRCEERGRHHQPEFTIIEWYRCGFDHHRLMADVEALLRSVGAPGNFTRMSFADLFAGLLGTDPHTAGDAELAELARDAGFTADTAGGADRACLFDAIFATVLQPALADRGNVFVYDFPLELAAYARLDHQQSPNVAQRFELLMQGVEIANGYHEVIDAAEQSRRFEAENTVRRRRGLVEQPIDRCAIDALAHGIPECAGVALGFDRLLMLLSGCDTLAATRAFADAPIQD